MFFTPKPLGWELGVPLRTPCFLTSQPVLPAKIGLETDGRGAMAWRQATNGLPEPACLSVTIGAQGIVFARRLNALAATPSDGCTVSA